MSKSEMQKAPDEFQSLPPIEPREMIGLWSGRGIPSSHPFDGVLENLGSFGKRFTPDMRADALLFRFGERRLVTIDPARIPLRLALRFHDIGRMRVAKNLLSFLQRGIRAKGPVASLKTMSLHGVDDDQPIVDHFPRMDDRKVMGAMTIQGDDRIYFFELERVDEPLMPLE